MKKIVLHFRKKKSFTLLEIVIGLLLSTILVGGLFEIQRQFNILQKKVEQAKQIAFERERLYSRLSQIFKRLTDGWIENDSLVLKYTDSLDHDRNFRDECLARLDKIDDNLILTTYGKGTRQEVLLKLEKNAQVSFDVFDPTKSSWSKEWQSGDFKKMEHQRSMIKIIITPSAKTPPLEFPFWVNL